MTPIRAVGALTSPRRRRAGGDRPRPVRPVRTPRAAIGLVATVGVALTSQVSIVDLPAPVIAGPATAPSVLPQHLGIGLGAQPDVLTGWMPESGVPWDYAYQYLAGGVETDEGWQGWTADAQFPLDYADDARALGYVPTFSYYMLLQSRGPCEDCDEAEQNLATLGDASTMRAYYEDFALLMRRLGTGSRGDAPGFGHPVIVHVEPDLSAYAQQAVLSPQRCFGRCTGVGNDASHLRSSVASSGHPDLVALPDTYKGFNNALERLRDLYAPNVLLGFHVSGWSTLVDVGSNADPSLDAGDVGRRTAEFALSAGARTWDLVFNDVADRDAGFAEAQYGTGVWWDRTNRTLPNFTQWLSFLAATVQTIGRPAVVWQVPVGNQVFRSVNDSWGHFQDNRAEYFFARPQDFVDAGVIAIMFGAGAAGTTTFSDAQNDRITNPRPKCRRHGGEGRCSDRRSNVPDDDGGFLRAAAMAYLRDPVALPSHAAVPGPGGP